MLAKYATYKRREWLYAAGELASFLVFAFTASSFVQHDGYGMPRASAGCFLLLSIGWFALTVCIHRIDPDRPK